MSAGAGAMAGLALVIASALSGCAMPKRVNGPPAAEPADVTAGPQDDELYTDLIHGMLAQGQYYAALAHVQEQQNKVGRSNELTYLEAESRRHLGQSTEAGKLYRSLLRTGYAGQAEHGLGLLHVQTDLAAAIQHLRSAVQRRPTDVDARNDLGYALTLAGRYGEALPELATAVELDPNGDKARNNLIVLLIASGDEAGARRVAEQSGTPAQTLARLRRQAQSLDRRPAATRGGK